MEDEQHYLSCLPIISSHPYPLLKLITPKKATYEKVRKPLKFADLLAKLKAIKEIKEQLSMRGVALGRAKDKSALLALWETNTLLTDKRPPVFVRPAPAFAAPVQPIALERLRAEQNAVPATPPRR